jgi:hypothetical protein
MNDFVLRAKAQPHTAGSWPLRRPGLGTSSLETLVALTLLTTALAFATPLAVRHGRLLTAQRDYRLALDELTNQLERLTALSAEERAAALERLTPSEFAAAHLRGAAFQADLHPADSGQFLTLKLSWDEPQRSAAPVQLTGWCPPNADQAQRGLSGSRLP